MQTLPEHGHQLRLLQASVFFIIFFKDGVISKGVNSHHQKKSTTYITLVPNDFSGSKIIAMALNVSETVLIALTDTLQLMSFALKSNKGKVSFPRSCCTLD